MTAPHRPHAEAAPARSVFDHILVGVDGTKEAFDACRQAGRLAEAGASIEAATVVPLPPAAGELSDELERTADSVLEAASRILGPRAHVRRLHGLVVQELLAEAASFDATLLAVGSHGHRRLGEILLGGAAGELLHQAPCSVLFARPAPNTATFPREIVVGVDGSPPANAACEVAAGLAARLHGRIRCVVALEGNGVDLDDVRRNHREVEPVTKPPVAALVEASRDADLLVVGSRGLHGLRALGSVSERVAHQAACSVLVVR
jgi:nucleotide-binding universal stress UspA family protein